jgi:putative spermidine/putrescine transport system permease protein
MGVRPVRFLLGLWVVVVLAFLFGPIAVVAVYAFNASNVQSWPLAGTSLRWFAVAWADREVAAALWLSLRVGAVATALATLIGTAAALAVHRYRFVGRDAVSLLLVLPIALPGIITGMALNAFFTASGLPLSFPSIVIGHTPVCIVVVYNNVLARLRRVPGSLAEASMDLGADGWRTFRLVTFPLIAPSLVAGALLAFALSFDEVIVTTFTAGAQNTLPLWIFGAIRLGQRLPEVNVVVLVVTAITVLPVLAAYRAVQRSGP